MARSAARHGDISAAGGAFRKPGSSVFALVILLLVAILGAVVLWLAIMADDTVSQRQAAVPSIVIPVERMSADVPVPEPAAGASGASTRPEAGATTGLTAAASAGIETPATASPAPGDVVALAPAPIPALVEETPAGPLPRIGDDGMTPREAYARPFDRDDPRPRIALVISDMGLSTSSTGTAISKLPGPVTLAFSPYAENLDYWVEQARSQGHEVLLDQPMEPTTYPRDDPGPNTLLTSLGAERNRERLEWVLSRASGYVGLTSLSGSRFTADGLSLRPVLQGLDSRGLLFLDSRVATRSIAADVAGDIGLPVVVNDRFIDRIASRAAIDEELRMLERTALAEGSAVGIAYPYPVTLERLAVWFEGLNERGVVLAPISAVADVPAKR